MGMQCPDIQEGVIQQIEVNGVHMGLLQLGRHEDLYIEQPTVVFIHGFTGCATSWGPLLKHLAEQGMHIISLEMLGHGRSSVPEDPQRYAMEYCQEDILAALRALEVPAGKAILVGYSMGGRIALYTALSGYFRALLLESTSPGLPSHEEREQRRRSDEALANCIEDYGIEAFVNYWERRPIFASQVKLPVRVRAALRQQRLRNSTRGLANSLRGVGTGSQPAIHDRLGTITVPVLLLSGEEDQKFCAIARDMVERFPQARHHIIPGAGHTMHLEKPEVFEHLVRTFCCSVP
ncbi:2-succinyl-6-hydroxy-2,4-cyclohexadiene-1-carboxylate synthase [Dictyobacter formicarum]|uniref:Putative 2-succinyl-6-hydroxy-2,4-cyclohexadiene-1-carboxylate synthase n=1 Tax=Dictyobacter formicarum TaxID=2778368 RepID=A0ABQ3VPM0_9CHLR|nr:2-succinyl-6-hydroxy-2,4-cyclohexadiene-1-carboxylate synthase [Dictyobacter formicarum]GHO87326.1 putative 2-succinyl-6-hydroxy-2,4-cyclohexadiene-1-carboxylate synthase [Dictyobacter formicarum]